MGTKAARKRIKLTPNGKLIHRHINLGHNKAKKRSKTKRNYKRPIVTSNPLAKKLNHYIH